MADERAAPGLWARLRATPRRLLGRALVRWSTVQVLGLPSSVDDVRLVYVLARASVTDAALLGAVVALEGLPPLVAAGDRDEAPPSGALALLRDDPLAPRVPAWLERLLAEVAGGRAQPTLLCPVNVFWGRAPEREASATRLRWLRLWAAEGWGGRSRLRKLFAILFFRRDVLVKFAEPIALAPLVEAARVEGVDGERLGLRIARVVRAALREDREAVVGPDLSHRRTLVEAILREPRVRAAIAAEAEARRLPSARVEARAAQAAFEIAADYSYITIRLLDRLLTLLWQRIYEGVAVSGVERLQMLARDHTLVYVPCHRSHIDYLLLSYVVHKAGLTVPHIAAGENLNLPLIGRILRGGGAFFLRRSFKDDALYGEVFAAYVHEMLKRGFPIEYFVEGGRSRTGRMLPPKAGLISMTVQSYLREHDRPLAFVPVYIGYEKLIEGASYTQELSGAAKRRESVWGLIRAVLELRRERYGEVGVTFGTPVLVQQVLDDYAVESMSQWLESKILRREVLTELSRRIACGINRAARVNPVALVASGLLATPRHAADLDQLVAYCERLAALLPRTQIAAESTVTPLSGAASVMRSAELGYLERRAHVFGEVVSTPPGTAVLLTYFRNNIQHLLALPGLIACLVQQHGALGRTKLARLAHDLYAVLAAEFYLPRWGPATEGGEGDVGEAPSPPRFDPFEATLASLVDAGWLVADETASVFSAPPAASLEAQQLDWLSGGVRPALVRHALLLGVLVRDARPAVPREEAEALAQEAARHLALTHLFDAPEFSDRTQFRLAVDALAAAAVMRIDADGQIVRGTRLAELAETAAFLLPPDTRVAVRRTAERQATRSLDP
jgi:glycerol-3-phosphate O-acyltransferase